MRVRVAELVGGLSLACDLGAGTTDEAALRTSLVATTLGRIFGLAGAELRDVYYTGVLRYIGCSGFAHETARLGAGDDFAVLAAFEQSQPTKPGALFRKFATQIGLGATLRLASDPKGYAKFARAHCDQAMALATTLAMSTATVQALGQMHERWDGKGEPAKLKRTEITLPARLLALAWCIEVWHRAGGFEAAVAVVAERAGGQLEPGLCELFAANAPAIRELLAAPSVWDAYLAAEPTPHVVVTEDRVPRLALAFARYVDLKSPWTLGHSERVAELAVAAGGEALRIPALLHDLGRVSVPNGIWDKPGPLNAAEQERVRLHAYHGERWLARCPLLASYAPLAGRHHERLDGTGYHRNAKGGELDTAARILAAADVYAALTQDRPHRVAVAPEAAAQMLADEASAGRLCADAVRAVLAAAGQVAPRVRAELPCGLTDREAEVLRLVARGLTNKEIGAKLFVSPKTAKNHIAHIYEKTGVQTRAAAALFAVEHGLA